MLKQIFHKLLSIALTVVLIISTVSFAWEKHYCGEVLIDFSFMDTSEKCGMDAFGVLREHRIKKSCCKDTIEVVTGQNQLSFGVLDSLDFEQVQLFKAHDYPYHPCFELCSKQRIPHKKYRPLNLMTNIPI